MGMWRYPVLAAIVVGILVWWGTSAYYKKQIEEAGGTTGTGEAKK